MAGNVKVKICGLMRRADVLFADARGSDYVGVILSAGYTRTVTVEEAKGLVADVAATPVAVFVDEEVSVAARAAAAIGAGVVQLHGEETRRTVSEVSALGPWKVWKAVRVREPSDLTDALARYADVVDGLLVEGWKDGVVGGGGARADLQALSAVRNEVPAGLDLVLAGGLNPENVAEGVARFRPSVVDVSSGVEETLGQKSDDLVYRFIEEARRASDNANGAHL
ncbi:MAG: phosphoribosylanthranilate isomerase [Planctomycetota bacterium]|jgi:phosphoribosylanthranilate isomerase